MLYNYGGCDMKKLYHLIIILIFIISVNSLSGCSLTHTLPKIPIDNSDILKLTPKELNVDWDKAIEDAFNIYDSFYSQLNNKLTYIDALTNINTAISVDTNSNLITIDAPVFINHAIPYEYYIENLTLLMRFLNQAAREQDIRIPQNGNFSCGGIFDVFETKIQVYSEELKNDSSEWLINDTLKPGEHRKRSVYLYNGDSALPLNLIFDDLLSFFPSDSYPAVENLDIQFLKKNQEADSDAEYHSILIYLDVKDGISEKDALTYSDSLLRLLNRLACQYDARILKDSSKTYGGLFDLYEVSLSTATYDPNTDSYKEYVSVIFSPGKQNKLELCQE